MVLPHLFVAAPIFSDLTSHFHTPFWFLRARRTARAHSRCAHTLRAHAVPAARARCARPLHAPIPPRDAPLAGTAFRAEQLVALCGAEGIKLPLGAETRVKLDEFAKLRDRMEREAAYGALPPDGARQPGEEPHA